MNKIRANVACAQKRESLQERLSFAKCGIKKGDEHRPGSRRQTGRTTVGENFHSCLIEVFKGEEDRKLSQHNGGKSCFEVALIIDNLFSKLATVLSNFS